MDFKCVQCGSPVAEEFGRCSECKIDHQKLIKRLDAAPKTVVKRDKEDWVYFVEIKQGIPVKTFMTREEVRLMGKKLPDEVESPSGRCTRCGDSVEPPRILCDVCRAIKDTSPKRKRNGKREKGIKEKTPS
jgi:hypothetical protein